MNSSRGYASYVRVSTERQGELGASLGAQSDAVERYAFRHRLSITHCFVEIESAASRGRREFGDMLRRIRRGEFTGVIIHKIDRSARNLRDWAELGELIDSGVDVRFAHETLDLRSRGGRLTADIQAVVAADFIRNLREETRKGIVGRLQQGVSPFRPPLGYRGGGPGRLHIPDPATAPIVRHAFELYATGTLTLASLVDELSRVGLRSRLGRRIGVSSLAAILSNPFYIGTIRHQAGRTTYPGQHDPLISPELFAHVRRVRERRESPKRVVHDHVFRQTFRCDGCQRFLVGERQKSHTYYRCHTRGCVPGSIREERFEDAVLLVLDRIQLAPGVAEKVAVRLEELRGQREDSSHTLRTSISRQLQQIDSREKRLLDLLVDHVDRSDHFEARLESLCNERESLKQRLFELEAEVEKRKDKRAETLAFATSPGHAFRVASPSLKRRLMDLFLEKTLISTEKEIVVGLCSKIYGFVS